MQENGILKEVVKKNKKNIEKFILKDQMLLLNQNLDFLKDKH